MEIKQLNKIILSAEVNGRVYELYCPSDSPLGELHDVLLAFKGDIVNRLLNAQEQETEVKKFVNNETDVLPEDLSKPEVSNT